MYTKRHVGDKINGATLIRKISNQKWEIKCPCGNVFVAQPSDTSGLCPSCSRKMASLKRTKHHESPSKNNKSSRLYRIWSGMRNRCNNPNNHGYEYYGKRGIHVCSEWDEYLSFKNWALNNGYSDELTIDRINNDDNYCPENCRWVTALSQSRNKRSSHYLTCHGETKTISEWAEIQHIKPRTLNSRINRYNFTPEEAITLNVCKGNNKNLRHLKECEK